MQQQTAMVAKPTEQQSAGAVLDLLKTVFHLKIARYHIKMISQHRFGINSTIMENADIEIGKLIKEIKSRVPQVTGAEWLEADVSSDKLFMAATLVEMVARIGVQEGDHYYEEFCDLLVSLLDEVFYAQSARRKLHFGKYKALFELIRTEIRADINRTNDHYEGQIMFKDRAIWIRTTPQVPQLSQIQ